MAPASACLEATVDRFLAAFVTHDGSWRSMIGKDTPPFTDDCDRIEIRRPPPTTPTSPRPDDAVALAARRDVQAGARKDSPD
jgi:hypothetical protein